MSPTALADGRHVPRPDHVPAFAETRACTLQRLVPCGGLAFLGAAGWIEAHVVGADHRAVAPLHCLDLDGSTLFSVERYGAADNAVVAFDGSGAPLATFLQGPGIFDRAIDVRDATTVPIGRLQQTRRAGGFGLIRTDGRVLAECRMDDVERGGWIDDEWTLRDTSDHMPLRPLAVVAMVLAGKVLLGRPTPAPIARS